MSKVNTTAWLVHLPADRNEAMFGYFKAYIQRVFNTTILDIGYVLHYNGKIISYLITELPAVAHGYAPLSLSEFFEQVWSPQYGERIHVVNSAGENPEALLYLSTIPGALYKFIVVDREEEGRFDENVPVENFSNYRYASPIFKVILKKSEVAERLGIPEYALQINE